MVRIELSELVVGGIFGVLAVLGNGFVIVLMITRRRLHTTANFFVLSLAVADLVFGVSSCVGLAIYDDYLSKNERGNFVLVGAAVSGASVTNLCVMILDRYTAIVYPLRYVTCMTVRRVRTLITTAWLIALLRPLLFTSRFSPRRLLDMTLFHIIPFIALLLATTHVLLIVRRHSKRTAALSAQLRHNYRPRSSREGRNPRNNHRMIPTQEAMSAKVLVAVVSVFLFSYGVGIYSAVSPSKRMVLLHCFNVLLIANSAINPLAYALFKTDMKREIRICFRRLAKRRAPLS